MKRLSFILIAILLCVGGQLQTGRLSLPNEPVGPSGVRRELRVAEGLILANCNDWALELIHEQLARWPEARNDLDRANAIVERHQLDTIRPRLWMRMASFHRLQSQLDSALLYVRKAKGREEQDQSPLSATGTESSKISNKQRTLQHFLPAFVNGKSSRVLKHI